MSNPGWKKFERRVAKELGGKRRWLSRSERKGAGDIDHPFLEIECKLRKQENPSAVLLGMPKIDQKINVVVAKVPRKKGARVFITQWDLINLISRSTPPQGGFPPAVLELSIADFQKITVGVKK